MLGLDLWFVCLRSVEGFDSDLEFKFCISIPRQVPSLLPSLSTLTLLYPSQKWCLFAFCPSPTHHFLQMFLWCEGAFFIIPPLSIEGERCHINNFWVENLARFDCLWWNESSDLTSYLPCWKQQFSDLNESCRLYRLMTPVDIGYVAHNRFDRWLFLCCFLK